MDEEYVALMKNKTWDLVELPPNRSAIGSKWVYRVKYHPNGSITKYKARLVAQGFNQRSPFDCIETFSLVVKPTTIRLILTLALSKGWSIRQLYFTILSSRGNYKKMFTWSNLKATKWELVIWWASLLKPYMVLSKPPVLGSPSYPLLFSTLGFDLQSLMFLFSLK